MYDFDIIPLPAIASAQIPSTTYKLAHNVQAIFRPRVKKLLP
jgi:hypothetical protein